jgi:hypothetical protein
LEAEASQFVLLLEKLKRNKKTARTKVADQDEKLQEDCGESRCIEQSWIISQSINWIVTQHYDTYKQLAQIPILI